MITVTFVNGCRATLRTSGTEPKVKYYAEMIGAPKNPPSANEEEEEETAANINQAEEKGGETSEGEWSLEAEKTKIQNKLDDVVKTIVEQWFDL